MCVYIDIYIYVIWPPPHTRGFNQLPEYVVRSLLVVLGCHCPVQIDLPDAKRQTRQNVRDCQGAVSGGV